MTQNIDLVALIGSRICHDLISPIGAINNGIELMEMAQGHTPGPEMALITESVRSASARIRFFRIAFGAAGDQQIGQGEVVSILADVFGPSRIALDWRIADKAPRRTVRMCFLALMCIETALPYGGTITFEERDGRVQITGTGEKINLLPNLWEALSGAPLKSPLAPAQVQFGLLPQIAKDDGQQIGVTADDTHITLTF